MADKSIRIDVEQPEKANLPKRVSYSQMSLYQQCGLKYFFSYIDGWREPPTSALAGGSITHEVVEFLYRLAPADRTLEAAMELLREHGPRMLKAAEYKPFETDNKMKHSVKEAIENLFKVENPPEVVVQPEHLEMELSVEINGVNFFGKVDRFTVDGVNRVTDYKTGKSPGKFIDDKLAQPYLYALGFKTQYDIDVDDNCYGVTLVIDFGNNSINKDKDLQNNYNIANNIANNLKTIHRLKDANANSDNVEQIKKLFAYYNCVRHL